MLNDVERRKLNRARELWEKDQIDDAWNLVQPMLAEHPYERDLCAMAGHIYEKAGNTPVSYHMFKLATEADPREGTCWLNFGRVAEDLWRTDEARRAYEKALKFANRDDTRRFTLGNLAALCIDNALYPEAEQWAKKALEQWPDFKGAQANLGFAQLGQRNWAEGWANYRANIGTAARPQFNYKNEPQWDGTPGQTVVLHGEQGIGDEISFASMLPDAIRHCKKVIVDCDKRLANLFRRSFPEATIYGTRQVKTHDCALWAPEDREFDASLPIGQIGEYFRTSADSFPGTPYLKADPERTLMWKALWSTKGKPVIGIAWHGGIARTGKKFRRWTLEQMLPLFRSVDAHWVVLEYKSAAADVEAFRAKHPEVDIREYPHATLTADYDDTAALVASLDMVFCIQTAVAHLGGALGVPTWVCVPPISQWRYGSTETSVPWYDCVRVIRQHSKGAWDFNAIARELAAHFGQKVAEKAA